MRVAVLVSVRYREGRFKASAQSTDVCVAFFIFEMTYLRIDLKFKIKNGGLLSGGGLTSASS